MQISLRVRYMIIFSLLITLLGNFLEYIGILTQDSSVGIRYFFILFPILVSLIPLAASLLKHNVQFKYISELKTGVFVVSTFFLLSIYKSWEAKYFIWSTIGELARIVVPFIYVFIIINFLTKKDIHVLLVISLLTGWIAFLTTMNFSDLNLQSIATISFVTSNSPFENSEVSFLAYVLAIFFIYFKNKYPVSCFFSIFLVLFTFKRVLILSVLILFIVRSLKLENKKVNNFTLYISSLIWLFVINFYNSMVQPQNYSWVLEKMHIDIASFSMYRVYRVWYLIQHNFVSYGLGSTTQNLKFGYFTGTTLEMDFIQFIMELGFISIVIFIFSYYRLTRKNLYGFCVMSFTFLQLLLANGISGYFEWSILLLTLGLIYYDNAQIPYEKIRWPFI